MINVFYDPKNGVNNAEKTHRVTCDNCGCVFDCEKEDVFTGEYGCPYVMCPCCGERAYFDCAELEKKITPENLVYPDDFWVSDMNTAYHVSDDEVRGMIKDVVHMATTGDEYFYFTERGDRMVMTILDDDNVLSVHIMQPVATTEFRVR